MEYGWVEIEVVCVSCPNRPDVVGRCAPGACKEYEWDLARREKFDQRASVVLNSFRLVQIDKLPLRLEHNYPLYLNDGWSMDGWMDGGSDSDWPLSSLARVHSAVGR